MARGSGQGRGRGAGRGFRQLGGGRGGQGGRGRPFTYNRAPPVLNPNPSPQLLTAYIKNSRAVEALLKVTSLHESKMNHIHLSACFNNLGRLASREGEGWQKQHWEALEKLERHAQETVEKSKEIRARELANISHGLAKSGLGLKMGDLMGALGKALKKRAEDCNSQEIANVAWAFAKAER